MKIMRKLLFVVVMLEIAILGIFGRAYGTHSDITISLDLINNGGSGNKIDDAVTVGRVSEQGTKIAVEVFAKGVTTPLIGLKIEFDFKSEELKLDKVENSAFLFGIPEATGINFAGTAPVTLPESGFIGRAEFSTVADVTGKEFYIGIKGVTLAQTPRISNQVTSDARITFNSTSLPPPPPIPVTPAPSETKLLESTQDSLRQAQGLVVTTLINLQEVQSSLVAVRDSLTESQSNLQKAKQGDLNFDGIVNFSDFLIFSKNFGKDVN